MVNAKDQLFFSPAVLAAITLALIIYLDIIPIRNRNMFNSLLPNESIVTLEGYIESNPTKTSSGKFYSVKAQIVSVSSSIASSAAQGDIQALIPSNIVEALYPGKLYSNTYDMARSSVPLIEQGLHFKSSARYLPQSNNSASHRNELPLYILNNVEDLGWKTQIDKIRSNFRLEFKRVLFAWNDAGGLLLALLSGAREYTDENLSEGFKNAGLSHILALSGMHLSLFASMALTGGKFLAGKKTATILSLIAVIVFVWFAGLSPSLFRALVCTLIATMLQFCALPGVSGNSEIIFRFISPSFSTIRLMRILSLSFIIHVSLFPNDAYTAAFMLSYSALVGISFAEYFVKPYLVRFLSHYISTPLSAAIGAQICTSPITVALFSRLTPIGILSSVIVSPLALSFLMIGFFCITVSMAIPFLLYPFGVIIQMMYSVLEYVVLWFAQFPPIIF